MTSITGLERAQAEGGKRRGGGQKRGTFANRFLLGFFMNETWIGPCCWLLPPPPPGGGLDMEEPRDVPGFMEGEGGRGRAGSGDRPR